jgi:hypothetical protein
MQMTTTTNNRWLALLAAALCLPGLAWSQANQYYLVAQRAPEGSISAPGQQKQVVYLRWDAVEGELPADVVSIRLTRDGAVLLDKPVGEVMPPAEIQALYSGPAQERRLLEIVLKLKQDAVVENGDFPSGDFATEIWNRISPTGTKYEEGGWAHLASRGDINVAAARYRGYIDDPGDGVFNYELLAVSGGGATARLGFVTVDTSQLQSVLGASDFEQVALSQCDVPEGAKDHYTVALSWDEDRATNLTDQFAANIYSGGYDLYRTVDNLDVSAQQAPPRNIAAEAAVAGHDSRGVPILDGLEMANDVLLAMGADATKAPEWIETQAELRLAGLKPGDKRGYYLVPRDFTGNYGPTLETLVIVPDLVRPPTPWDLRPVVDAPGGGLALSWDDVNLANYVETFGNSRVFCNLPDAPNTGVLEFVAPGEDCDVDPRRSVRIDANNYYVYRFPSFEAASSFKDSDGDGVADSVEDDLMMQCDAAVQPAGTESMNYLLDGGEISLTEVVLPDSGKETWRLVDPVPVTPEPHGPNEDGVGDTFWYRVAAKSIDGRLSGLSAPQRGFVPDRALPPKPNLVVARPGRVITGCELVIDDPDADWNLLDRINGSEFSLSCTGIKSPILTTADDPALEFDGSHCQAIRTNCFNGTDVEITLTYPDPPRGDLCVINLPADRPAGDEAFQFCEQGQARLVPTYADLEVAVTPGEYLEGPATAHVSLPAGAFPDVCMDLYESIGDDYARTGSSCDTLTPGELEIEIPSGFFCGYAVARDGNNNVSETTSAPCTFLAPVSGKTPTTPQPVSIDVDDATADISWRLPVEPIAATLVSLDQRRADGNIDRQYLSFPSAGSGSGGVIAQSVGIPALAGSSDEFCVRYKSLAPNTGVSNSRSSGWSPPQCVARRSSGAEIPTYLPWPIVPAATEGTVLAVGLQGLNPGDEGSGLLYIDLGRIDVGTVGGGRGSNCLPVQREYFYGALCTQIGRQRIQSKALSEPFLVYRQRRDASGVAGNWVQVSPLIDYSHFDSVAPDTFGRELDLNDPHIGTRLIPAESDWRLAFVDRYPYRQGEYRYQVVYFDGSHRIIRWRQSDWISTAGGS